MKRIILAVFFCLLIIVPLCSGTSWNFDGSFDYSIVSSNYAGDIPGVQKVCNREIFSELFMRNKLIV